MQVERHSNPVECTRYTRIFNHRSGRKILIYSVHSIGLKYLLTCVLLFYLYLLYLYTFIYISYIYAFFIYNGFQQVDLNFVI